MTQQNFTELIIAEKDQQASDLALALNLTEDQMEILIPSREYLLLENSLMVPFQRLFNLQNIVQAMQSQYSATKLASLKKYQTVLNQMANLNLKIKKIQNEIKIIEINGSYNKKAKKITPLEKLTIRFWHDNTRIIVACSGHLLDLSFKTQYDLKKEAKKLAKAKVKSEEEEEEESESEEEEESESEKEEESESEKEEESESGDLEESDLDDSKILSEADFQAIVKVRFDLKKRTPAPYVDEEKVKYARFKLIESVFKQNQLNKVIVATDFDREGQSIAGSLIEYFKFDFTKVSRMKFSTLETSVLQNAYANQVPFDLSFYNAGKARQWVDFVIGMNLNPQFSNLYTTKYNDYLVNEIGLSAEIVKDNQLPYRTFNIGRVKNPILNYIYEHTHEQIDNSSNLEPQNTDKKEETYWKIEYTDNSDFLISVIDSKDAIFDNLKFKFDFSKKMQLAINEIELLELNKSLTYNDDIPSFLNLTKVFDVCKDIGASTEQINRILEYLYLQKFISYPRSKSERWEIKDVQGNDDEPKKLQYANSVLNALKDCGYPIKDDYYDFCGNEGTETHSHPCIHPLPSLTKEKIEKLKTANPLAFLILNEIIIYTLRCFEVLPLVKVQKITYELSQDMNKLSFYAEENIEIIESNILEFTGLHNLDLDQQIDIKKGNLFEIIPQKAITIQVNLESNRSSLQMLNDFDIVRYMNEQNIGTDATRPQILGELIENKYLVSPNVLLTTFLGNLFYQITDEYVSFLDIDYTIEMEKDLSNIENSALDIHDFEHKVKYLLKEVCHNIFEHAEEIQQIFIDAIPHCEKHDCPMIFRVSKFGAFLQCPHYYQEEEADKCDKTLSL